MAVCSARVASSETGGNYLPRLPSFVRRGFCAAIAGALFLLSGCASEPTQLPAWTFPKLPPPHVAPLPLAVGVHYPNGFLHEKYEEKSDTVWYIHEPGGASAALLNSVLAATFKKVVRVPTWPPANGDRPDVALVIVPHVSGVSTLNSYITYDLDFYTPGGVRQGTWSVLATAEVSLFGSQETFTDAALREAAAKLLVGLRERPELSAYLTGKESEPQTRVAASGRAHSSAIALVPRGQDDDDWLTCIQDGIRDGAATVQFIGSEQFRDATFPWFEPSVEQPTTPEAWARRLSDPLIADGAVRLGARYALLVGGHTENGPGSGSLACSLGPGGGGCFGFTSGPRHTGMQLTLVDFVRREFVGNIDVSESGSYTWIGLILPIPIIDATESEACRKASREVRRLLKGR